ncbi:hypothetical protein ScPMuIL_000439 [Solemya velum]
MATEVGHRDPYIGEKRRFLRNGHGVYIYENGFFRYEGQWKNGRKHGHGKLVMKDGSYYEGQFVNGEIQGYGYRYYAVSHCKYSGQFYRGEANGKGKMCYRDGSLYEGDWKENKKEGIGTMKYRDSQLFQGAYHQNRRHGMGTMVYVNGDKYHGDWINDRRQGHGTLQMHDGTVYEGQFLNDLIHGQGRMTHASGMAYDGLWSNGAPVTAAAKIIVVTDEKVLDVPQGSNFSIRVECRDEEDEIVQDQGRELQIMAGFKYHKPKEGSALFDMIEDVDDKPIVTPFGYDIVPYPLSEALTEEEDSAEGEDDKKDEEEEGDEEDHEEHDEQHDDLDSEKPSDSLDGLYSFYILKYTQEAEEIQDKGAIPLLPPLPSRRTLDGVYQWTELKLPPAPPMYRPFVIMDGGVKKTKSKPKLDNEDVHGESSNSEDETADSCGRVHSRKSKTSAIDEASARIGEYVIMVQDVTNPPFLGKKLDPAFILVKVTKPKKVKKEKEKQPKWDTQKHIARSLFRSADGSS